MFFGLFSKVANSAASTNQPAKDQTQGDPLAFIDELVVSEKLNKDLLTLAGELKRDGQQARELIEAQQLIGDGFQKGTVESLLKAKAVMVNAINKLVEDARQNGGAIKDSTAGCLPTIFKLPDASNLYSPVTFAERRTEYCAALEAGTVESLQKARSIFSAVVDAMVHHINGFDPSGSIGVFRQPSAQVAPPTSNGPITNR
jgi:hypothetical protein